MRFNLLDKITIILVAVGLTASAIVSCSPRAQGVREDITTTVNRHEALAAATVNYATWQFLLKNPKSAERVIEVTVEVRAALENGAITSLKTAGDLVRSKVRWDKLQPQEAALVNSLIAAVQAELELRFSDKELPLSPDERVLIGKFVGWVQSATQDFLLTRPKLEK